MSKTLLECREVEKVFLKDGRRVEVLRGINFSVAEREALAILGTSGAGKSTFLHVLGTLESPSSGQLLFEGKDISKFTAQKLAAFRNESLGFVFQFHYLLQEFTALENVLMPVLISGKAREQYEKQARELLEEVGLSHRVRHRPSELSGGEQQRVAVARALIMRPKLLLADEPTGNLDSENAAKIRDILLSLNRDRGVTILLVTHDKELAQSFPRQLTMRDGRIVMQ